MYKYTITDYIGRTRNVITDAPVGDHTSAQAGIKYTDAGKLLISYETPVAFIGNNGEIECYGLYSRTTIKHIGWFAKMYGLTYYDFKRALR